MTKKVSSHTKIFPPLTLPRELTQEFTIPESPLRTELRRYILLLDTQKKMATNLQKQGWLAGENEAFKHADVRSFLDGKFNFIPTEKLSHLSADYFNLANDIELMVSKRAAFLAARLVNYRDMIAQQHSITSEMRNAAQSPTHAIEMLTSHCDDLHVGHVICGILDKFARRMKLDDCDQWKASAGCPEHYRVEFKAIIESEVLKEIQGVFVNTERYLPSLVKIFTEIGSKRVMQICQLKASETKINGIDQEYEALLAQIKDLVDSMGLEMRNSKLAAVAKDGYTHENRRGASKEWKPPTPKK